MGKTTLIRRLYSPATISSSYEIEEGTLTRVYEEDYVFDRDDWELVILPSFYASSADGTLNNKLINRELSKVKLMYAIGSTSRWYDITEVPKFSELDYWLDDTETDSCGAFMFCGKTTVGRQFFLKLTAEWRDKRNGMVYQVESENIEIVTLEKMADEKRLFIAGGTNNIEYNPFIKGEGSRRSVVVGLHSGTAVKNLREEVEKGRLKLAVTTTDNESLFDKNPITVNSMNASISFYPTYRYAYTIDGYIGSHGKVEKNSQGYIIAPNGTELYVDFVSIGGYVKIVLQGSVVTVYPDENGKCTYFLESFDVLQSVAIYGHYDNSVVNAVFGIYEKYLDVKVDCGTKVKDFVCLVQLKKGNDVLDTLPISMKRIEPPFDVVMENNAPLETGIRKIPYSIYVDGKKVNNPTRYFDVSFEYKVENTTGQEVSGKLTATNDKYLEIAIADEDVSLELTDATIYKETIND